MTLDPDALEQIVKVCIQHVEGVLIDNKCSRAAHSVVCDETLPGRICVDLAYLAAAPSDAPAMIEDDGSKNEVDDYAVTCSLCNDYWLIGMEERHSDICPRGKSDAPAGGDAPEQAAKRARGLAAAVKSLRQPATPDHTELRGDHSDLVRELLDSPEANHTD